jgi:acetylornithine deacetylase/succinyl-diaminopimelate desuccinylase-like protein
MLLDDRTTMTVETAALVEQCLAAALEVVDDVIDLTCDLARIPAPTFAERERAEFFARRLDELGLEGASIDNLSNVTARVPGADASGSLVLAGHLDTVFPMDTPLTIERRGDRLHGPGIGDNSLGAAAVAFMPVILRRIGIEPPLDLVVTGNVGEEGLGDLCGIRRVVDSTPDLRGVIAVEGHNLGRVTHIAVGSRRIRVQVKGPGGHSWGDFGRPNAIHVASEIISELAKIPTPPAPKTTLSVGMIEGGISVNTIPPAVSFLVDMRSVDHATLLKNYDRVERILRQPRAGVTVTWDLIGDRPAGSVPFDDPMVRHALDILHDLGIAPIPDASSTDANISISRGIPSVCIGLTSGGNAHRPDEYIDIPPIALGLAQLAALIVRAGGDLADGA